MNTTIQTKWYESIPKLAELARYIIDKEGELDTVYFLEKPWKWENEWNEYLEHIKEEINKGLDEFDRRDK